MRFPLAALAIAILTTPSLAAEPLLSSDPIAEQRYDLILWAGGGIAARPDYDGSDDYEAAFMPLVDLDFLRIPGLGEFGRDGSGFSLGPSFNVVGERNAGDNPALTGLGNVDLTVELGLRARYAAEYWQVYGAIRHGLGGHEGLVGEVGINGIAHLLPNLTLIAGPRISFADGDYHDAYFSVNAAQSAASGLPVFDADGGVRAAGVDAELIYQFDEDWRGHVRGRWERLVGDAADSPIVANAGDDDQFYIGAGLAYRIKLDLFD